MLHSDRKYLEADLLVQRDGSVTEGDGVAETGLPLHRLLGEVHDDLGSFGIRMKEQRAHRKGPADGAALDG